MHCMSQNYTFFFYAKNHKDIKIMLHEDIMYISYRKYINFFFLLVICIAKNFIWTTLKMIFLYLDFFASSDSRFSYLSQILSKPYINGNMSYSENGPLWLVLCSRVTYNKGTKLKTIRKLLVYGVKVWSCSIKD